MALLYKTRGMGNPGGKPKVFFCCHPEDFDTCFEPVTNVILAHLNCAIWYDREDSPLDDERRMDLEGMQLLVVPVTTRLLSEKNRAMDEIFPFMVLRHIPVLPLMQESGLDELFNNRFGDLQYLDQNVQDSTAISFDEKLKKFLDAVLVGDELAAKVRAAFDAYIFLSYRKKDRKYANELMRLIHRNEFCRDIAIWYDEYLVPGENFNDSIARALERCDLFALAVTPNLVNEINYVMTTEYPAAVDAEKTILPAEVVSTDRDQIREKYDGIPECVDAHDEKELSRALMNALQRIALLENDGDPQHNFFIGLAYLNGIDVEVNYDRATELITMAAQAGLPEATEKLVDMYRNGMGVERNYEMALSWRQKLVEQRQAAYDEGGAEEEFYGLFDAMLDLGSALEELQRLAEAQEVYQRMEELCMPWMDRLPEGRRRMAHVCELLGNVRLEQGFARDAKVWLERALKLAENLAKDNTLENRRRLASCQENMGKFCLSREEIGDACGYYRKSRELWEALAEETGTEEDRRSLAECCKGLGVVWEALDNRSEDKWNYYEEALEVREQLAEETGATEDRFRLFESLVDLGDICSPWDAWDYYWRALWLMKELLSETRMLKARRNLGQIYAKLGRVCEKYGEPDEALKYFRRCLAIDRKLIDEFGTLLFRRDLTFVYTDMGDACMMLGESEGGRARWEEASGLYRKAVALRKELLEETDLVEDRQNLADSYDRMARAMKALDREDEALEYCEESLKIRNNLAKIGVQNETARARVYAFIGGIYEGIGKNDEAIDHVLTALDIIDSLSQAEYREAECCRVMCDALGTVCRIYKRWQYFKGGNLLKLNALASKWSGSIQEEHADLELLALLRRVHLEILAEETELDEDCGAAADAHYDYALVLLELHKDDKALENLQRAIEMRRDLAEEETAMQVKYREQLAELCRKVCNMAENCGHHEFAKECLQESLEIWNSLSEEYPENADYRRIAKGMKEWKEEFFEE